MRARGDRSFPEAADGRPISDEALILCCCGLDQESALFVAGQLGRNGYVLGLEADILDAAIARMSWDEIDAFQVELRKGQDVREDAGGYMLRAIRRLFGKVPESIVETYQDAARTLVARAQHERRDA